MSSVLVQQFTLNFGIFPFALNFQPEPMKELPDLFPWTRCRPNKTTTPAERSTPAYGAEPDITLSVANTFVSFLLLQRSDTHHSFQHTIDFIGTTPFFVTWILRYYEKVDMPNST
jgi:hypothetical protein